MSNEVFWGGGVDFTMKEIGDLLNCNVDTVADELKTKTLDAQKIKMKKRGLSPDLYSFPILYDMLFRLPEILLVRLDKLLMHQSIEGRVPFLNKDSVEIFLSSDVSFRKSYYKSPKNVLRKALSKIVDIPVSAAKKGFRVPIKSYRTSNEAKEAIQLIQLFNSRSNIFHSEALDEHVFKAKDRQFLSIYIFVIWYCIFIENLLPEYITDSYV